MLVAENQMPGVLVRDHEVTVPLDWCSPDDDRRITVFARELVRPTLASRDLPYLLYLQGGPGGKSHRPLTKDEGWTAAALDRYRIILLDQRGTGRSTAVQSRNAESWESGTEGAEYLLHFRADSIIRDAEYLREHEFGVDTWTTLGQSYGGWLTMTYLSFFPDSLDRCFIAGGLGSIRPNPDAVYRRTYPRAAAKTGQYYDRYPADATTVAEIADLLTSTDVRLPDGDRLTVRRLQSLGGDFGMKPSFERMHWLLDEAFNGSPDHSRLSDTFLEQVMVRTGYSDNPLYAVLQESIYGSGDGAPHWSCDRIRKDHPEFGEEQRPLLFTGEMIYPWMFDEIRTLRPYRDAAHALADVEKWSVLYDPDQLRDNTVPVFAALYHDDMYVDRDLGLETAATVGALNVWVTNEFEHDGLRNGDVLSRLFALADDLSPVPAS